VLATNSSTKKKLHRRKGSAGGDFSAGKAAWNRRFTSSGEGGYELGNNWGLNLWSTKFEDSRPACTKTDEGKGKNAKLGRGMFSFYVRENTRKKSP